MGKLLASITNEKAGLWIDHKQKVLPMIYREGQVEYFGKKGMSLLGAMLVRRVERATKGKSAKGLSMHFMTLLLKTTVRKTIYRCKL